MENLQEAKVYVGTYGKYNDGYLSGKWFELSDFETKQDFISACKELHKDEADPELLFTDYEDIPNSLISECWISEHFFTLRNTIQELPECEQEPFMVWFENGGYDLSEDKIDNLVDSFRDEYHGQYNCEESFAEELVDSCYTLPNFALNYFNFSRFADDLFSYDYWFENGYVFRRA